MAGFSFRPLIRFFFTAGLHPHAGRDAPVGSVGSTGSEAFASRIKRLITVFHLPTASLTTPCSSPSEADPICQPQKPKSLPSGSLLEFIKSHSTTDEVPSDSFFLKGHQQPMECLIRGTVSRVLSKTSIHATEQCEVSSVNVRPAGTPTVYPWKSRCARAWAFTQKPKLRTTASNHLFTGAKNRSGGT